MGIGPDLAPWRSSRDFRLLLSAETVSTFGTFTSMVALPLQLAQLTHSPVAVGLLGACELVPVVVCGLYGGALADAVDRRRLILACDAALVAVLLGLLLNSLLARPLLWPVYLGAALVAGLSGMQGPSRAALVPTVVPYDKLTAAVGLAGSAHNVVQIAGPALGGVLMAVAGVKVGYAVDLATYAASYLLIRLLRATPPSPDADRAGLAGIAAGLRYAGSRPDLVGTYVVDMVAMVLAMPTTLFVFLAADLHADWSLGLLYAAESLGALLASATSGWASRVSRHGKAIVLSAAGWGLAIACAGLAPTVWLALLALAVSGYADMTSGIFRVTMWNQTIPDDFRGRLSGIELLMCSAGPTLGQLRAGGVAAVAGVRAAIASGGLLCAGGVAVTAAALPALWNYDERTSPEAAVRRDQDQAAAAAAS